MKFYFYKLFFLAVLLGAATSLFSADSEPVQKVKVVDTTETKVVGVTTISGINRLEVNSLTSISPIASSNVVYTVVAVSNPTTNMNVNGAVTPVNFDAKCQTGGTCYLDSITFILDDGGTPDFPEFGSDPALTNGVDLKIKTNGTEYLVSNMKNNTQIALVFNSEIDLRGTNGFLDSNKLFFGKLIFKTPILMQDSTSDYVRFTVRDDLRVTRQIRASVTFYRVVP